MTRFASVVLALSLWFGIGLLLVGQWDRYKKFHRRNFGRDGTMRSVQGWARRSAATLAVVLSGLMLIGCHSRAPIAVPWSAPPPVSAVVFTKLRIGDHVRVTSRTANRAEFVVAEVQAEALVAEDGRRFPYADITRLEKTRISKGKTLALTLGLLVIGAVIAFYVGYVPAFGSLTGGGI